MVEEALKAHNPRKGWLKDSHPSEGLVEEAWKAPSPRRVLVKEALKAPTSWRVLFRRANGQFWCHFGPKAGQMFQMINCGVILYPFGPKAAWMMQMVSFDTILDPFGPKVPPGGPNGQFRHHFGASQARCRPDGPNGQFCNHFEPFPFGRLSLAMAFFILEWLTIRNNPPLEMTFHSE